MTYGKEKGMVPQVKMNIDYAINVVLYSYRDKDALRTIDNLLSNTSNKSYLNIRWYDQNGLEKSKPFYNLIKNKVCNGSYNYIFWDDMHGPVWYRDSAIQSLIREEYLLLIYPGISFSKNWDIELINFIKNKDIIISGNKDIILNIENNFFIDKKYSNIKNFKLNNFIDRRFIFGATKHIKRSKIDNMIMPRWLKYYGDEEILSLQYFKNNIGVFACPSNIYTIEKPSTIEDFNYYVTFSKYHNYNLVLDVFKNNKNTLFNQNIVKNFINFHNVDFTKLHYLPFNTNDVEYNYENTSYDRIDGSKFITKIKRVD